MNKQLASLMCLVLFATMPACRKCKNEKKQQQEEINTMIEINDIVEEEKIETKKSIAKF
jgi:hypothetical protein